MKSNYFILFLLGLTTAVSGQTVPERISIEDKKFNNYFVKGNIPRVKGKIINLSPAAVSKTSIQYSIVTPFSQLQLKKTCGLNADGTFQLELDYPMPYQQIWIDVDSLFYTGVYANDNLFIELDAAVLKREKGAAFNSPGVKFLGPDGPLNVYTNNHVLFQRKKQLETGSAIQAILPVARTDYVAFKKNTIVCTQFYLSLMTTTSAKIPLLFHGSY